MPKFKIGDRVIVVGSENTYGITKDGSTGVIKTIMLDRASIDFDHTTGTTRPPSRNGWCTYTISLFHIQLIQEDGKSKIERKINTMWKRQPYNQGKDHAIC